MSNKVKYGIKNVYYSICTISETDGSGTYGAPKALKGAVNLSLEAQGENTPFYADDVVYFMANGNSGYSGDLELAIIPEDFLKDVLGHVVDANGVVYEKSDYSVVHFALTFEFDGDANKTRHIMYNCTATRPAVASSTRTDTTEPSTESITITATPIYNAALACNITKAYATPTQATQYNAWNTTIYQPTGTATT